MVRASRILGRDNWVVRKNVYQHNCPSDVVSNENHQVSSQFVGELLKEDFSLGINERACPRDVMSLMRGKHRVDISYHVACKAQSFTLEAIRSSVEQSYSDIPSLCVVLKDKNPRKCLVDFM